jgi:CBS domain containing-hemolysin-like protein
MEAISIGWMVGALVVLLVISGFFSIAETSMMAINRYRLKHMAAQGHGGAPTGCSARSSSATTWSTRSSPRSAG